MNNEDFIEALALTAELTPDYSISNNDDACNAIAAIKLVREIENRLAIKLRLTKEEMSFDERIEFSQLYVRKQADYAKQFNRKFKSSNVSRG